MAAIQTATDRSNIPASTCNGKATRTIAGGGRQAISFARRIVGCAILPGCPLNGESGASPSAADKAAGFRAGIFSAFENGRTCNEGRFISLDPLHKASSTGGKIVCDLRGTQAQPVEVDQIDVGTLAGLQPAAVMEAEEIGGFARLAFDDIFERQPRSPLSVAAPVGEHVSRRARVDDHCDMRA